MARAAAKALDASVALIDRSSAVLAVAGASPDEEQKLLAGGEGVTRVELRVADSPVGELRYRSARPPEPAIARMVATLLALELERSRSPEWESEEAAGDFVPPCSPARSPTAATSTPAAAELGADLEQGAGVLILPAAPRAAQTRRVARPGADARAAGAALAGARARWRSASGEEAAEIAVIVPAEDDDRLARAAAGLARELEDGLAGFHLTIGRSRHAADPVDLYRAGNEARLAVNVGEAEGRSLLAFEDTGAYRLLLPAMSEDPASWSASTPRRSSRSPPTTSSTRPSWWRRSRPTWTTTATSPPPRSSSSPTATRSATGSSGPTSSAATTSPPPRAARSSASG